MMKTSEIKGLLEAVPVQGFTLLHNGVFIMRLTSTQIRVLMLYVGNGIIDPDGLYLIADPTNTVGKLDEVSFESSIQPNGCLYNDLAGLSYDTGLSIALLSLNNENEEKKNF